MKLFLSTLSIIVALSLMASQSPKRKVTISLPSIPGETNVSTVVMYLSSKQQTLVAAPKTNITLYWDCPLGETLTNLSFQIWHTTNLHAKFTYGNYTNVSVSNALGRWTLATNVIGVTNVILPKTLPLEFFSITSLRFRY